MDGSDHIVSAIVTSVSSGRRTSCVGLHDDVLQKILIRTREWHVVICDYHSKAHQCHHEKQRVGTDWQGKAHHYGSRIETGRR